MLHLKHSSDIDHAFHAALEYGFLNYENDFKTFFETVPEALFNVTFPFDCTTGAPSYDIPYGYGTSSQQSDGSCGETIYLYLYDADLSFGSISGSSCNSQEVELSNCNCIGTTWTIPPQEYGSGCPFYFPLHASSTDFSFSTWTAIPEVSQSLSYFENCNFGHSIWRGVELQGDFYNCDLSHATFHDIDMGSWQFETSIMTGVEFRCMNEGFIYSGDWPPEWQYESDPNCSEPNRYRFFQP